MTIKEIMEAAKGYSEDNVVSSIECAFVAGVSWALSQPDNPIVGRALEKMLKEEERAEYISKQLSYNLSELFVNKYDITHLADAGIITLGDLLKQTEESLMKIHGFGKKRVSGILHYMDWVRKDLDFGES